MGIYEKPEKVLKEYSSYKCEYQDPVNKKGIALNSFLNKRLPGKSGRKSWFLPGKINKR